MDILFTAVKSWFEPNRLLVGNITTLNTDEPIRAPNYWQAPYFNLLFEQLWLSHKSYVTTYYSNTNGCMFNPTYKMDKETHPFDVVIVAEWNDPEMKKMALEKNFQYERFVVMLTAARRRAVKNGTLVFTEPPESHMIEALEKTLGEGNFVKYTIKIPSNTLALNYYVTRL